MSKDELRVSNELARKLKKEVKKNLEKALEEMEKNPEEFMSKLKPFTIM